MPIRVLIVDDSALIREILAQQLVKDGDIEIAGVAIDPYDAREKIKQLNPDVLTLDIEMPNMNGIAFLERLMRLRPMPVVMVSSLTQKGADVTLMALEMGAVDFVGKPLDGGAAGWVEAGARMREKVRTAARSRLSHRGLAAPARRSSMPDIAPDARTLIAVGASTGGVEALRDLIQKLPAGMPPIVVTQHMPPGFTMRFAQRLRELTGLNAFEAQHGNVLSQGDVAVAPGHMHLQVELRGGRYICLLSDSDPVSGHKPSVDVLFRSVAGAAGRHGIGIILTGMGRDGADGLLEMRRQGAQTIGQSESSCLVYGMPRAASEIGAVMKELPLEAIPEHLVSVLPTSREARLASV